MRLLFVFFSFSILPSIKMNKKAVEISSCMMLKQFFVKQRKKKNERARENKLKSFSCFWSNFDHFDYVNYFSPRNNILDGNLIKKNCLLNNFEIATIWVVEGWLKRKSARAYKIKLAMKHGNNNSRKRIFIRHLIVNDQTLNYTITQKY